MKIDKSKVIGLMSTMNPTISVVERVQEIANQVRQLVLVVDKATEEDKKLLKFIDISQNNILIIYSKENIGIASVLNLAAKSSSSNMHDYFLFLDDDSDFDPDFVDRVCASLSAFDFCSKKMVAGVNVVERSAVCDNVSAGSFKNEIGNFGALKVEEKIGVITSGMIVKKTVFYEIGELDDSLFIDCVDYDFCLRAKKLGMSVVKLSSPSIYHKLGDITYHSFIGLTISVTNHSPLRRRYYFRNTLKTAMKYIKVEPKYAVAVVYSLVKIFFGIIMFEKSKGRKLKCCVLGFFDFLMKKNGQIT